MAKKSRDLFEILAGMQLHQPGKAKYISREKQNTSAGKSKIHQPEKAPPHNPEIKI